MKTDLENKADEITNLREKILGIISSFEAQHYNKNTKEKSFHSSLADRI